MAKSDDKPTEPVEKEALPKIFTRKSGKEFPLRDVLHVVTGVMLSKDWDDAFALVCYMTGQKLSSTNKRHFKYVEYPLAEPVCRANLLEQFPDFKEYVGKRFDMENSEEDSQTWLEEVIRKHGEFVNVDVLNEIEAKDLDDQIAKTEKAMNPPRKAKKKQGQSLDALLV